MARLSPESRKHLEPVRTKLGPKPLPKKILPPKHEHGAKIFEDLGKQFHGWDRNHDGWLDREELRLAFAGNAVEADRFLKRLDRDREGRIARHAYDRWALEHTHRLMKEHEARKRVEEAKHQLQTKVATARRHDEAEAAKTLHRIKEEREKKQREHERQAAVSALRSQRKKEHTQQAKAHDDLLKRQRELAKLHQRHAAAAKHVTPRPHQAPKHAQSVRKPPNRPVHRPPVHRPPPKKGRR